MMACLVLAIIPIIVFYLVCQKYIVSGVMAGAVKVEPDNLAPLPEGAKSCTRSS